VLNQQKIFHVLRGVEEALNIVFERVKLAPKGVEHVPVLNSLYRVLASDVYAPIDYPPFDRSEVDGYAVKSSLTAWANELSPVALSIRGEVQIGEKPESTCRDGVVRISTGAMIPRECDAVVMEEYAERENSSVKVYRPVVPGENIATAGSDISAGDLVLSAGTLIRHEHVALLAGLGIVEVPVYSKPRVAVFSTGSEVVSPGEPLREGCVYDVNGYLVTSYLRELGADAFFLGRLVDDYNTVRDAVESALREYDIIVTSGGTSAGVSDVVYRVFGDLGEILVHGLKTKPGKPTVIALSKSGKLLIGLPGFPLSCYMILVRLVKPVISKLTGLRTREERVYVKLPFTIRKGVGKTWLLPAILVDSKEGYAAYPVSLSSGSIYAILYSEGFIELREDYDVVEENTLVPFYPFREIERVKLVIIGSNDPLLEDLLKYTGLIHVSRILNVGSTGGWHAVIRGEADIAPTHLLDPDTGLYNTPFLDKYGLRGKAVLIRGFDRLIGLVVAKGNPKSIRSLEDFFRSDVVIVNRTKGSGIRTFLDTELKKIAGEKGVEASKLAEIIRGYTYEVKTHSAVALAVKQGRADVGLAVGYVAELYDLDFIPLKWEEYDFLVHRERLNKALIKEFLSALRDRELLERVTRYPEYYRYPPNIGEVKAE
jgi:putative molybdopterin biosynthesis protein